MFLPSVSTSLTISLPCVGPNRRCVLYRPPETGSGTRSRPPTRPWPRAGLFGQTPLPATALLTHEGLTAARTVQVGGVTRNVLQQWTLRAATLCSKPHDGMDKTIGIRRKYARVCTMPPITATATRPRPPPPNCSVSRPPAI